MFLAWFPAGMQVILASWPPRPSRFYELSSQCGYRWFARCSAVGADPHLITACGCEHPAREGRDIRKLREPKFYMLQLRYEVEVWHGILEQDHW